MGDRLEEFKMDKYTQKTKELFDLKDRVIIITGGAGMLGKEHGEAIAEFGGIPVLLDIDGGRAQYLARKIGRKFGVTALGLQTDITKHNSVKKALNAVLAKLGRVDGLINNAANNPKIKARPSQNSWSRFENFPLEQWNDDLGVGLTGAFICSQIFGKEMARRKKGVILNIASDLAVIAPDQRIYRQRGLSDDMQPVKPVTYSVSKHGLVGLTKYLASFWGQRGIRVNAISPGGVYTDQPNDFVKKLTKLIPLGRMARVDEYQGAVVFLLSDRSGYITGANIIIDGGRTCV